MLAKTITAALLASLTITSIASANSGVKIIQPPKDSDAMGVGLGGGLGVGLSAAAMAKALSAAGIAAVPHVSGGMILISTATGASYIAGTLGLIGGAAACAASVVCAVAVAGGAAIAIGGGYYAYEAITAKNIDFEDVISNDKSIQHAGQKYFRIKDKFVTPERRDELNEKAADDDFNELYYVIDGVLIDWGIFNDNYYLRSDLADELKHQFDAGGLYEIDGQDKSSLPAAVN